MVSTEAGLAPVASWDSRPPTAVALLPPFLAIGYEDGSVKLANLGSADLSHRPSTFGSQATPVLALALAASETGSSLILATATQQSDSNYSIKIFSARSGRLRTTISAPHHSPPVSLSFSPASKSYTRLLASISPSELILSNPTTGETTWALRDPSASAPSPAFSQALWCSSSSPLLELIGLWSDGNICLWTVDPSASDGGAVQLQWRAGPKTPGTAGVGAAVGGLSKDGTCFVTTCPVQKGARQVVLVWDAKERCLLRTYDVEGLSESIDTLQVVECGPDFASLIVSVGNAVFVLELAAGLGTAYPFAPSGLSSLRHWMAGASDFGVVGHGSGLRVYDVLGLREEAINQEHYPSSFSSHSEDPAPVREGTAAEGSNPPLDFDPAWLSSNESRDEALVTYLASVGSYPAEHRPAIYHNLLNCPSSPMFFTFLSQEEDQSLLEAFRAEWELEDILAQARMESLIHLLHAHGFDPALLVDRVPPLVHGFVTCFADDSCSPQQLFEVTLAVLLRWGRVFWDPGADADRTVLFGLVEELLKGHDVLRVFRETGASFTKSVASVSFGLLNGFLPLESWVIAMDHIVSQSSPRFFLALLTAILVQSSPALIVLSTPDAVRSFFRKPHKMDMGELVATAMQISDEVRGTDVERRLRELRGFGGAREGTRLDGEYRLREG